MRMYSVILNRFFNINMDHIDTYIRMHDLIPLIPHRNNVFSSDMDAMIYSLACQQPLLNSSFWVYTGFLGVAESTTL
jgi:hypothetical protein